jgi:hypothetical protein
LNARALLGVLAALALIALWHHAHRPIAHAPGILAANAPLQEPLRASVAPLERNGFTLKPLAKFSLSARVLARADYRWDTESALAPVDLALGWGRMSDSAVLDKIDISQSARFYFWHAAAFPIPVPEIIESSANMHLIPADRIVQHEIERSRVGDVISFDGYLVAAGRADGYRWVSSLSRTDTGPGACELVWIEHFTIAPR